MSLRRNTLLAATLGLSALDARAASLVDLLDAVPAPPESVPAALAWTDHGRIVAPEYLRIKAAIQAERAAIAELGGGSPPEAAPTPPEDLADDLPEVRGAARAYLDYLAATAGEHRPAAVLGKRARWLHVAMSGKLGKALHGMAPCALPCTDAAALAQNQAGEAARHRLAEQDLRQWDSLLRDWRQSRLAVLRKAQGFIDATGEGRKALTARGRATVAGFRAAMLGEIENTLSITELAMRRYVAIETADVDAVSGATATPAKAGPSKS